MNMNSQPSILDDYFDINQFAEFCGVTRQTVWRWLKEKRIAGEHIAHNLCVKCSIPITNGHTRCSRHLRTIHGTRHSMNHEIEVRITE